MCILLYIEKKILAATINYILYDVLYDQWSYSAENDGFKAFRNSTL